MLVIERTQHLLRLVHDIIDFIFTRDRFAVDFDQSPFARFYTQLRYDLSVDLDASLQNPFFRLAPGGQTAGRNNFL